jgi:hypothetical protein
MLDLEVIYLWSLYGECQQRAGFFYRYPTLYEDPEQFAIQLADPEAA